MRPLLPLVVAFLCAACLRSAPARAPEAGRPEQTEVGPTQRDDPTAEVPSVDLYLVGKVRTPPNVSAASLRVRAGDSSAMPDMPASEWNTAFDVFRESGVGADGSFRLGPFASRKVRAGVIRVAADPLGMKPEPGTMMEAVFALPAAWDVDLTSNWPGELRVQLLVEGRPAVGFGVASIQEGGQWCNSTANRPSDAEGIARLQPMPGSHALTVLTHLWAWEAPERVEILPGGQTEISLDVPASRGSLVVLDATTAKPLSRESLWVSFDGPSPPSPPWWSPDWKRMETDRTGTLSLTLPEGRLTLGRWRDNDMLSAVDPEVLSHFPSVEWTRRGPASAVVSVP